MWTVQLYYFIKSIHAASICVYQKLHLTCKRSLQFTNLTLTFIRAEYANSLYVTSEYDVLSKYLISA